MTREDRALAALVRTGTPQFAASFQRAQAGRANMLGFDTVVPAALPAEEAFATAFAHARAEGWLALLAARCVMDRIVTRDFPAEAARQTADPGMIAMQGLVERMSPFLDTILHARGLFRVADYICRIVVDGEHRGTGFLVRPDLVMTAGHVISPPDPLSAPLVRAGAAEPGARERIEVLFDDKIDLVAGQRSRQPRRFGLAPDWLITHSAPAVGPGALAAPDPARPDFAVIRLETAPLPFADSLTLASEDAFAADPLLIVQHPKGKPMCHQDGLVEAPDPASHVFTHTVNTQDGSSGAPCFNTRFEVVGLHSGEVLGQGGAPRNAALSITVPAAVLATLPLAAPPLRYLSRFALPDGQARPVIGREETQDWLRTSLGDGAARILAVSPTPTRKSGMSFTADLLTAVLPPDQHRIVRLSAEQFANDSPPEFARRLLAAAGAPPVPPLPAGPEGDTTRTAWLRYGLVPEVMIRLNQLRDGRMVWIVLDDLRVTLADGNGLRECLDLIYESVDGNPWLRLLLLGYAPIPPQTIVPYFTRITLPPISTDQFRDYFLTRLAMLGTQKQRKTREALFTAQWGFLKDLPELVRLDFAAVTLSQFLTEMD